MEDIKVGFRYYHKILQNREWVRAMNNELKLLTIEYATLTRDREAARIKRMIETNPNFEYPQEFLPDKKYEYWDNAEKMRYSEACNVIEAIEETMEKKVKTKGADNKFRGTLEKACIGSDHYQALRAWFIDNGLCNPDTFVWKDTKRGGKSILLNYLKDAHEMGYIQDLNQAEIRAISLNDFGFDISRDTIKRLGATTGKEKLPPFRNRV